MGETETLTLSVQHPVSPPPDLPFNLHRLIEEDEIHAHQPQQAAFSSPLMDQEAYAHHYGATSYPEQSHPMGLGIHYVSSPYVLLAHNDAKLRSRVMNIHLKHTTWPMVDSLIQVLQLVVFFEVEVILLLTLI